MVTPIKNIKFYLSFIFFITIYPNDQYIDVITTNDMHGFIDEQTANFINPNYPPIIIGGSGFIQYVNEIKEDLNNQFLVLDGGNFFQGHPLGLVDSGRTMIEWMNHVGYHAMVPGSNDFLFGVENLVNLCENLFSGLINSLLWAGVLINKRKKIKKYPVRFNKLNKEQFIFAGSGGIFLPLVKPGSEVKKGQKIGEMGNTGKSTATHLHYEVQLNRRTENPNKYFFDISNFN